mmetsp:Transcript_4601/g.4995  ORF Transcript_4601/g.4995 Transcript_4601/m.4995 type:complete len:177 (+) Transcript_4601:25-555(+)
MHRAWQLACCILVLVIAVDAQSMRFGQTVVDVNATSAIAFGGSRKEQTKLQTVSRSMFNDVWMLHKDTLEWVKLSDGGKNNDPNNPTFPPARVFHLATMRDSNTLMVTGGTNQPCWSVSCWPCAFSDVWSFNIVNRTWTLNTKNGDSSDHCSPSSILGVPSFFIVLLFALWALWLA